MQKAARPRSVWAQHRHPYAREPTHGSRTQRLKDSKTSSVLLPPSLLPYYHTAVRFSRRLNTPDSVISAAPTIYFCYPSVRIMTKTEYSRNKDSIFSYCSVKCDSISRPEHRRPQENPDRNLKNEDRGPGPRPKFGVRKVTHSDNYI